MTTLEAIARESADKLHAMFTDAMPEIEAAISDAVEQSQADDTVAKFRLSFSVEYNLDKSALTYRLAFGVRKKWETCNAVPDPNQPELIEAPEMDRN